MEEHGRRSTFSEDDGALGVRMLLEQFADERFEGVEFAGARTTDRRRHGSCEILFHGAGGQVELPGDTAQRPMLAVGETMNSAQGSAAPEGCCRKDGGGIGTGETGEIE